MLVENYMSKSPITVRGDVDYKSAFAIMEELNIHHLPIINSQNALVGLVAFRDLQMAARCYLEAPVEIADIMHTPVQTAKAGDSLSQSIKRMIENRFGCLPIVDGDDQVIGMLTETDLFQALVDKLET